MVTPQVAGPNAPTALAAGADAARSVVRRTSSAVADERSDHPGAASDRPHLTALSDAPAALPARRDSDWGASPRARDEDLRWAAKRAAVTMAAAMLDECDGGTGRHCDDVVHLCDAIADELGVYGNDRAELLATAQLHDIGKVAIPCHVLNKPGPLDDHEWALIHQHTVAGERIVRSVGELHNVARLVRHSHERWDGGGYPDGLCGERIPLASRIVFCADTFHAIRSDRPYRRGSTAQSALDEITRLGGSQLDLQIVNALLGAAHRLGTVVHSAANGLTVTLRSRRLVELLV